MKKDIVIQVRISKTDKDNLKTMAHYAYMSSSKFITSYLDKIIEEGCIEEFKIQKKDYDIPLSDEELKEIVGGSALAIDNNDYNLARRILSKIKINKLIKENKDQYLNIRYSKDKKEKLDDLIEEYDTNISEIISNYIHSVMIEYGDLFKPITEEEFWERQKRAEEDIKAGRVYTQEEFDEIMKKEFPFLNNE